MRSLIAAALASCAAACSGPPQLGRTIASADGAFLADGMLRVFQVDPLDSAVVADGFASWGWYDFSDDGKWLAYSRGSSSGKETIEIAPAAGGKPVTVVDADSVAWWSPGPARLAFTRGSSGGTRRELWVVSPGEAPVRITGALAAENSHCGELPAFSPDGSRIAYLEDSGPNGALLLAVATADGARRELVRPPAGYAVRALLWSPDGTRLAYALNAPPQVATYIGLDEWRVADAATGSSVSLGRSSAIYWSPDGSRLFHVQNQLERGSYADDLHERAADGTGDRIVASTAAGERIEWAGWSPAGGSIAFVTGRSGPGGPVRDAPFIVVPGSLPTALPDVVVGDSNGSPLISWSPDAAWLVLVRNDPATGKEALLLESPDGVSRFAPAGAASTSVRTFGWSSDGRLAYVASSFPGSSVAPGGRAFAWAPSGSPVEAAAQGVNVGDLEWTPRGALIGTGSRLIGNDDYRQPLLVWSAAKGDAVEVANSVYSFQAARRHPDLSATSRCK